MLAGETLAVHLGSSMGSHVGDLCTTGAANVNRSQEPDLLPTWSNKSGHKAKLETNCLAVTATLCIDAGCRL